MERDTTPAPSDALTHRVRVVHDTTRAARHGIYLGHDASGWRFAAPQQSVLVVGPPRSGKTSALIIPNVLCAPGPVVTTSTKPDVLRATVRARRTAGRCLVYDPTGSVEETAGAEVVRWSPLQSCGTWDGASAMAASMVATSSGVWIGAGADPHWRERAGALLAPLLFAAAVDGAPLATVLSWVDRRQALPARTTLASVREPGAPLAADLLEGIAATDERELSGIWSTASGALAGYRMTAALGTTTDPDFDPAAFCRSTDTLYVCAPSRQQALVAPLVVGLLEDVRTATYQRARAGSGDGAVPPPVVLALDELANIAPVPDLPSMVSEGGGQGLVTLACLQDLSQARHRWGPQADGFLSLFGTTVVLPGIGDVGTLRALSTLAGDEEVVSRSASTGRVPTGWAPVDLATGGRSRRTVTESTVVRPRLAPDIITRGRAGHALAFDAANRPGWIPLAVAHRSEPWRSLSDVGRQRGHVRDRHPAGGPELAR